MSYITRFCMALLVLTLASVKTNAAPILSSFNPILTIVHGDWTLGYSFSSDTNTSVTALGYWDSSQNGLDVEHPAGIWDSAQVLLGEVTVASGTSSGTRLRVRS